MDGILSIQSAVAYGHVGNSAAVFPLQRLGFEVWPVSTVLFSNHTGYGAWRGRPVPLDWVTDVLTGIEERGAFARCRAVLSGYLGTPDLGTAVLDALARVRAASPGAVYACDPVMGDEGRGFFVRPGIPELFRERVVPAADIVTPNAFELGWLAGIEIGSVADARAAAARVRATGPRVVAGTSLLVPDRPGELGVLADTAEGSWVCWTPRLDVALNGTGDAFTALFLAGWLRLADPARALEAATAAMYALVAATHAAGSRELLIVAAQDELVAPRRRFPAERLR
jgi:pyridoxine kinase